MIRDRVEQTTTTTGTGTYSLDGTVTGRLTLAGAGFVTADEVHYLVTDNGANYEWGIGTFTDAAPDTLSRDTIIGSSNGGLAVNWGAGTKSVHVVAPAELFGPMGGRLRFAIAGGSANAITVAHKPPIRARVRGMGGVFEAAALNTGAVTLNPDGTGALPLRKGDGSQELDTGDISDGQLVPWFYDVTRNVYHAILGRGGAVAANVPRNILLNGNFDIWQRGTASLSSPAGSRTFLADRFYVNPAGAALTQQQSTTVPDSKSTFSLQLNGAASVTTVLIGQRFGASKRYQQTVTFAAYVFNGSGANFTPDLLIGTPTAPSNFATVNNRLTQALQSCTDGAWTRVVHTFDPSGFTDIANGIQVELRVPSGSLVAGDTVRVAQFQLVAEQSFGGFSETDFTEQLFQCLRYFYKTFRYGTAPAQNAGLEDAHRFIASAAGAVTQRMFARIPIPLRGAGTFTTFNPSAANAQVRNVTDGADLSATAISGDTQHVAITATGTAGTAVGEELAVHFTGEAEF